MRSGDRKKLQDDPVWIATKGSPDLGVIDEVCAKALGTVPAAIRLAEGFGGSKGYGLLHIEDNAKRFKTIKGLGFRTVTEFVASIAVNWTKIAKATEPGRFVLVQSFRGYDLRAVVELYTKGRKQYHSVVTALPGRKLKADDILYEKEKEEEGKTVE